MSILFITFSCNRWSVFLTNSNRFFLKSNQKYNCIRNKMSYWWFTKLHSSLINSKCYMHLQISLTKITLGDNFKNVLSNMSLCFWARVILKLLNFMTFYRRRLYGLKYLLAREKRVYKYLNSLNIPDEYLNTTHVKSICVTTDLFGHFSPSWNSSRHASNGNKCITIWQM